MTRNIKGILLGLLLSALSSAPAYAATYTAASCSTSDVQAAINSAAGGDTVIIPAGSCAWTSGVTISGKGITVTGQGSGRIIAYSGDTLAIGTGSKTLAIQSGLPITAGQTLRLSQTGTRSNYMVGTVSSYAGTTLTMNITSASGTGSQHRWLVSTTPLTTITNNSGTTLFAITEDKLTHTNISGLKIAQGTGGADAFDFNYVSGGRAILLHDCWVEQGSGDSVRSNTNRGVIWNCSFDSSPFSMAPLAIHIKDAPATSWTTASNMGMADTTGESNLYVEKCDFHAYLNATDVDDNGRAVFRYSVFNNAGFGTHGADTSNYGQRYFEYYNNTGVFNGYNDGTTFNMNWWFFVRGGTYVIYNNTLPALSSTDYGTKADINMTVMNLQRSAGPNACWGAGTSGGADYHAPRQVGMGYVTGTGHDGLGRTTDSVTYVGDSEPAYAWGNSRTLTNIALSDYGGGDMPKSRYHEKLYRSRPRLFQRHRQARLDTLYISTSPHTGNPGASGRPRRSGHTSNPGVCSRGNFTLARFRSCQN